MITSVPELIERGRADDRLRPWLARGGWYLVGSRAAGFADELSDWDTIILSATEPADGEPPTEVVDTVFPVERPRIAGPPTLEFHRRWRSVQAVEIEVLGPADCRRRAESQPVEWAYELRHAVPLSAPNRAAEAYRDSIGRGFDHDRSRLARSAYAAFRRARNEAVATLARPDDVSQAVTAAGCVGHAARYWLLAQGLPHPAGKWLLPALRRAAPAEVSHAMEAAVDLRRSPDERFDALWRLWRAVDDHAQRHGLDPGELAGSPFVRS